MTQSFPSADAAAVMQFLLDPQMIKATNPSVSHIDEYHSEECDDGMWAFAHYGIILRWCMNSSFCPVRFSVPVIKFLPNNRQHQTLFYQSHATFGTKITHRFVCIHDGLTTTNNVDVKLSTWVQAPMPFLKSYTLKTDHAAHVETLQVGSELMQVWNQKHK